MQTWVNQSSQAENVGLVHPGEEEVVWSPHSNFQGLKGPKRNQKGALQQELERQGKEKWIQDERGEI